MSNTVKSSLADIFEEVHKLANQKAPFDDLLAAGKMQAYSHVWFMLKPIIDNAEEFSFSKKELGLFREWFDCIIDVHKDYLELKDWELGKKVTIMDGKPVSRFNQNMIDQLSNE